MAWQSSTINPATTSPAADITKITNDLQALRTVLGGGTDADVPFNPGGALFVSGGNVGIGLSTPGSKLEVDTTNGSAVAQSILSIPSSGSPVIGGMVGGLGVKWGNVTGGIRGVHGGDVNNMGLAFTVGSAGSSQLEGGRITMGRNWLFGTTTEINNLYRVQIVPTASSNGCLLAQVQDFNGVPLSAWSTATTGNNLLVTFFTEGGSGTLRGSIDYNRAGTAVRYNTTSDARLKKNIADAPDSGAVLDSIKVRSFDWKESETHTDFGFVAQELVQQVPDAVRVGDDADEIGPDSDVWAVDYSKLVPLLVKEVQSLRARVAALETK